MKKERIYTWLQCCWWPLAGASPRGSRTATSRHPGKITSSTLDILFIKALPRKKKYSVILQKTFCRHNVVFSLQKKTTYLNDDPEDVLLGEMATKMTNKISWMMTNRTTYLDEDQQDDLPGWWPTGQPTWMMINRMNYLDNDQQDDIPGWWPTGRPNWMMTNRTT